MIKLRLVHLCLLFSATALAVNNRAGGGSDPQPTAKSGVNSASGFKPPAQTEGDTVKVNPKIMSEFGDFMTKCRATWKGSQLPPAVNAFSQEGGFVIEDISALRASLGSATDVSASELKSKLARLASECTTFGRNGSFYLCQSGSQAKIFDKKLQPLQSLPCDQVLALGSHLACLKRKSDANSNPILEAQSSSQSSASGVKIRCPEAADVPAVAAGAPGSKPYVPVQPESAHTPAPAGKR